MVTVSGTWTPASASNCRERCGSNGGHALLAGEANGLCGAKGGHAGADQLLHFGSTRAPRNTLWAKAALILESRASGVLMGFAGFLVPSTVPIGTTRAGYPNEVARSSSS